MFIYYVLLVAIILYGILLFEEVTGRNCDSYECVDGTSGLRLQLQLRMKQLRSTAREFRRLTSAGAACDLRHGFVEILGDGFGGSSNQLIEFTHGLWLADRYNATLLVPSWMYSATLQQFDTRTLQLLFCFRVQNRGMNSSVGRDSPNSVTVRVEDRALFNLFTIFSEQYYTNSGNLPPMDKLLVKELSLYFIAVYAGLWCCPHHTVVAAGESIIRHELDNNLRYTAVHLRSLDGDCNRLLASRLPKSSFSSLELPLWRGEWNDMKFSHPLCKMRPSMIFDTMILHNRTTLSSVNRKSNPKVFIAWDGRDPIVKHLNHGMVFSALHLNPDHRAAVDSNAGLKFVDAFIAMHADMFLLNPRSTLSWQVYVVRAVLGLLSVPTLRNNDFYSNKIPDSLEYDHRPLWVSWTSVIEALLP